MPEHKSLAQKSATVGALFENHKEKFAACLPKTVTPDRLVRLALNACAKTPKLLECTQASLLGAVLQAAQLGLEPDGTMAALIPYRNKGVQECQFVPMYRGLVKLAWNSGQVCGIETGAVRKKDSFTYRKGLSPILEHTPYEGEESRGELTHAYAIVSIKGGGNVWEVLTANDIREVKKSSRGASSSSSPWTTHEAEMWKKSALKRALKLAPLSTEIQNVVAEDDRRDAGIPADYSMVDLGEAKVVNDELSAEEKAAIEGGEA